jgi:hypothetical protein
MDTSWTELKADNEANRSSQSQRSFREPSQWRVLDARRAAAKRLGVFYFVNLAPASRLDAGAFRF